MPHCLPHSALQHFADLFAARPQRFINRVRVARCRRLDRHRNNSAGVQIHRMLGLVGQMRAAILHLRDLRIRIMRVLPFIVRTLPCALAVQFRQLLARGVSIPDSCASPLRNSSYDSPLSRRTIERNAAFASRVVPSIATVCSLKQAFAGQHAQHPREHASMCFHVDQSPRS